MMINRYTHLSVAVVMSRSVTRIFFHISLILLVAIIIRVENSPGSHQAIILNSENSSLSANGVINVTVIKRNLKPLAFVSTGSSGLSKNNRKVFVSESIGKRIDALRDNLQQRAGNVTSLKEQIVKVKNLVKSKTSELEFRNKRDRPDEQTGSNSSPIDRLRIRINKTVSALTKLKDVFVPKLAIRSLSVNLDWTNYAKSSDGFSVGSTLILYDGVEPLAHIMNSAADKRNSFYTVAGLEQDRIYKGSVKLLTQQESAKDFFYEEMLTPASSEKFELSTPFIVTDANVKNILETKEILERKLKTENPMVTVNYVNIGLMFSRIDKLGYFVEVARHLLDSSNNGTIVTPVEQTIQIFPPARRLSLAHQPPHELLKISLRILKPGERTESEIVHSVNVFTGSAYKFGLTNFSRLLDEVGANGKRQNSSSLTSQNITASLSDDHFLGESGRMSVRCYADDDVFSGYPCRNSDICIPQDWVCDGEADCTGRDDERGCEDDSDNDPYESEYYNRGSCRKYEFRCRSRGQSVCLPNSWLCDGRVDCTDGWDEDEENCFQSYKTVRPGYLSVRDYAQSRCGRYQFRCWTGSDCVSPRFVCDGHEDCLDGSDERICENWSKQCDLGFEFKCYKSEFSSETFFNRNCIPRPWVCDDQEDCPNGEDESYRVCRNFRRVSLANILTPFGIDFMINAAAGNLNRLF